MHRTLIFTGVGLLLMLTACTTAGTGLRTTAPVVSDSAATAPTQESDYVATAKANAPDLSNTLDDASIAAAGHQVCAALAAGTPMSTIVASLAGPYGAHDASVLIGTAADILCMRQDTAVDALIKTLGS